MKKLLLIFAALGLSGLVAVGLLGAYAVIIATPHLPSLEVVKDYRPKVPLRIFTNEGILIGEFGEERRNLTPINNFPMALKNAVIATEDDRFYDHSGVDLQGFARAIVANLSGRFNQGASTITMQVARNFFLSNEKKLSRKLYEVLLAFKIEQNLSKDQILELYMNQIYLGQRSYGFASAARIYFGKNVSELTIAESAMLAGLPKAPSAYNPVVNFRRAKIRQEYILQRMRDLKYITAEQYATAMLEELNVRGLGREFELHAEFVAENARQLLISMYGENVYQQGLNVYTTVKRIDQEASYVALRKGIMDYDFKHGYRGPEGLVKIPNASIDSKEMKRALDNGLNDHPSSDDVLAGVVLAASPNELKVFISTGEVVVMQGEALKFVKDALSPTAQPKIKISVGSIIRVMPKVSGGWQITQLPEVEGALISVDTHSGAILSMTGGFDFKRNQFNHAMMAERQPGSSFKPFLYAAGIEKGIMPRTIVNDGPLSFSGVETGGKAWEPKNYDGKMEGLMTVRTALAKSKNLVSVRIMRSIGPHYVQDFIQRFGFEPEKNPPYLTLALGAGSATPLQMSLGYSVFANGGYEITPYLIDKIVDSKGKVLFQASPKTVEDGAKRVLDARTAFVMDSLLQEVTKSGTAASARGRLKRSDIAGKTGTTNDSHDAWFAGYQPKVAAVVWVGFDKPRSLGATETGGGLALPIWINYMAKALQSVPESSREIPEGVQSIDGDWVVPEFKENAKYTNLTD